MDYDWDAIIIGGGPAGSTVARYAADGGAKVLVIDRRKQIGTPLQCGELVPTNSELKKFIKPNNLKKPIPATIKMLYTSLKIFK